MPAPPAPEDVRRIAAVESPVLRNLLITQCYARLSAAIAASGAPGANWCTFATWASRQAGRTIRGEDAQGFVEDRLRRDAEWLHPLRSLWRALLRRGLLDPGSRLGRLTRALHTPFDAIERASDAVARGNRKVFEEIGFEFARYLRECQPDAPVDDPAVVAFLEGLRPGEPPEGQRLLRQAFRRYQAQRAAPDPAAGAQAVLLANLEIGLHEQTRLQPEIREAMEAEVAPRRRQRLFGWPLQRELTRLSRELITETFMVLTLPGAVLALGRHLDVDLPPAEHAELVALLARYEPVPPAADDCGAKDWSVLDQRMHYIAHLFRAYHADDALSAPPFTPAQVERFRAGELPDGEL